MPTDSLTDAKVRSLKPRDKPYKVFDGGGLHVHVSTTGAKAWRLAYRVAGKAQTMSFGLYPEVTLSEARRRRDEARATLRDGADPMAPRRATKSPTLSKCCETYWAGRLDVSEGYRHDAMRCMERHIFPDLGECPIAIVARADLLAVLNKMDARGIHDYVRKARMWLDQVFQWAVEQELCETNPAAAINPDVAFGKRKGGNFAAVQPHEVPALMQRLGMESPDLQSVLACRFIAYTWGRTVEVRMMTWAELAKPDEWVVLAGRMKRARDHIVPLPRQAQEIVKQMRARSRGSRFVWPGDRDDDRPMSENAVLYLLHRIGYQGVMTGHGWRSVGSTWANERGYNPDAVEMQLAHSTMSKTRASYNRAQYLEERRRMLQDWADWLDAQSVS